MNRVKVATLIETHKILHDAKENSAVDLRSQPISIPDIKFVAFSDASFASEKVPDSHQGMMIMAARQRIGKIRKIRLIQFIGIQRRFNE